MRRSTLAVLATVSLAALVNVAEAAETVQSPSIVLGVLKPSDDWKVGTVDVTGASFCAMVNKYDGGVGLAFARSPEGYGTVAMDLRQNLFTPDHTYDVELKAEGSAPRKLQGRATSARSLVVQIGQDKALYDALKGNGTMELGMSVADVTFSLAKFSNSFKNLLNCSDKLAGKSASNGKADGPKMAAVKVQDVEQASLAPIDKEVQQLNGGAAKPAVAEAQNSLDAQLDDAASADVQTSKANIAKLDAQHKDVSDRIDYGREQVAQLEIQKTQVERKLLASTKTETRPVPPANTGAAAKAWDEQQAAAAAQRADQEAKTAALQQAVDAKDAQIAKLERGKSDAAAAQVEKAQADQKALDEKTAAVEKQRDAIAAKVDAAGSSKALKASLVAKEAQLADITAQRATERDQLTQKLSSTQSDFAAKIAALETEREGMKSQLDAAKADATKWQQADATDRAQTKDLQTKLAKSDDERHALQTRLTELDAQQKKTAAVAVDGKELADAKAALSTLKTQDETKVAALEEKLSDKTAQFDALKGQYETLQHQGSTQASAADAHLTKEHESLTAQVAQKQAEIDTLTQKLAKIEADRAAETSHAKQAQAGIVRRSLVTDGTELSAAEKAALVQPAAGNSAELEQAKKELADLKEKNAALSEQVAAEAVKADTGPVSKPQAELADLRAKNADLSKQLAAATQKSPDADKTAAELADLKAKNAELNSRLASVPRSGTVSSPELAKAQSELSDLRAKNAELSSRLASAAQPQKDPALQKAQEELADLHAENAALTAKLADAPDAEKAKAELADLRSKNAELSGKLAAASKPSDELADLKAKNAALEHQLAAAAPKTQPVTETADISAEQKARIKAAQDEIASLRTTKAQLEHQLATHNTASAQSPAATEPAAAPALAKLQPSAGDVAPKADASFDKNRAAAFLDRIMSYHRADGTEPKHVAADTTPVFGDTGTEEGDAPAAAPVVHHKPQVHVEAPHHEAVASVAPVVSVVSAPLPAPAISPVASTAVNHDAVSHDTSMSTMPDEADATPVHSASASQDNVIWSPAPATAPVADTHVAANENTHAHSDLIVYARHGSQDVISPAPTPVADAAPAPAAQKRLALVPLQDDAPVVGHKVIATSKPLRIIASQPETAAATPAELPRLAQAPIAHLSGANPTTLENLLTNSGVDAKFKPADGNVRQWVSGSVNGMYEQLPPGDFTAQAQAYVDRYRQDCPGGLTVGMGQPQTTAAGTFAEANVSCTQASNSYNTSFVFVQDAKKFSAILHTGYPEDAAKVRNIGDSIAYALGTSGGLAAPAPSARKADATTAPVAHLHDAPVSATGKGSASFGARSDDAQDTVVVQ